MAWKNWQLSARQEAKEQDGEREGNIKEVWEHAGGRTALHWM